jgi:hypothetical protein
MSGELRNEKAAIGGGVLPTTVTRDDAQLYEYSFSCSCAGDTIRACGIEAFSRMHIDDGGMPGAGAGPRYPTNCLLCTIYK